MTRPLLFALVLIAALATLTAIVMRRAPDDRARVLPERSNTARASRVPDGAPAGPARPTITHPAVSVPDLAQAAARDARQSAMRQEIYEKAWREMPPSGRAAAELEQPLTDAIRTGAMSRQARFTPDGVTATCRSRMCRVEAYFPRGIDGGDWATRLLLDLRGVMATSTQFSTPSGDGRTRLVIYGAPRGQPLPEPPVQE